MPSSALFCFDQDLLSNLYRISCDSATQATRSIALTEVYHAWLVPVYAELRVYELFVGKRA